MKCINPLCINYFEIQNPYIPQKTIIPTCLKHEFEINYQNITKIENCQDHKTYQQLKEEWRNILAI